MPWQVTARVSEGLINLNNQPMKKDEAMRLGQQLCQAAIAIHRAEQKRREEAQKAQREEQILFDTVPVFPPEGESTDHYEPVMPPPPAGAGPAQQNRSPQAPEGTGAQTFG